MKRVILLPCVLLILAGLTACGGGTKKKTPSVIVTLTPASVSLIAGQAQQFNATVSGTSNTSVTWSLSGSNCTGTACGTLDSSGLYKAPDLVPNNFTVNVVATSAADSSKSGTGSVNNLAVAITVSPNSNLSMISAETKQLTATVTNAPTGKNGVSWVVVGEGSIDSTGLYSAPAVVLGDGTVTINATSTFDGTKLASVTIALKAPVITIGPIDPVLEAGGVHLQFVATVTNVPAGQTGVNWFLDGVGSLTLAGLYTTPDLVSDNITSTIQAVSTFDPSKVAKSVVKMYPVAVTVSPHPVTLFAGQTQQFSASVMNHLNKKVNWTVTGATCGAGSACGTVDENGVYAAPSSISEELTVSLTAISVADSTRSGLATITLKPLQITVSPKTANVKISGSQQFGVTVQGSTNTSVNWSLSGPGCSGLDCGMIDSTGLYLAPPNLPNPPTVNVLVAAAADTTRTDTATITLIYDPNVKLHGTYAFVYTGWDPSGKPLDAIGSMVADGDGHLSGLLDMNGANTSYRRINEPFSGTYEVHPADNRGEMTMTVSSGSRTLRFSMDPAGNRGYFLLFESTGMYGSGMFKRQNTSDFSLAKLNGDYVMGATGMSYMGDERNALLGRFHTDGAGAISDTSLDITNTGGPTANLPFQGSISMDSQTGASSGRGTMSLTTMAGGANFSFFLVDSTEAYLIRTDTIGEDAPIFVGGMMKQTGRPYSSASLNGRSVFYMTGMLVQTVRKAGVAIGEFSLVNGTGTSFYTSNGGGSIFSGSSSVSFAVDTNGRATWNWAVFGAPFIMYLVAPNTGFILQYNDPGSSVFFGFFEPQTGGPFTNASLNGEYFGGAIAPATSGVDYGNGLQRYHGDGTWSGIGNNAGPDGMQPDLPVSGTYIITDTNTGAANWLLTMPGTYRKIFYVINPNRAVMVPNEPSNMQPALEIFEK